MSLPWPQKSAQSRWATFGPYYAMFPIAFAHRAIEQFCPPGGAVLDPFCGRGTVPFTARVSGRPSLGTDVNAVAYVFSSVKTNPEPELKFVEGRLTEIADAVSTADCAAENAFQQLAWAPRVLGFLRAARRLLDWRGDRLDRTVMALLLVHLHGKPGNAVSNGMRQSKSMAPDYAVRWWSMRGQQPPELDPLAYFRARAAWRWQCGVPHGAVADSRLGDAREVLPGIHRRFRFLLTSPPYCGVTHYRVDNWIRLWMLGESALPTYGGGERYSNRDQYRAMLRAVFGEARRLLTPQAAVLVRTDSRTYTRSVTASVLAEFWPEHTAWMQSGRPPRSQTDLFRNGSSHPGETDLLLQPSDARAPTGAWSAVSLHLLSS